MQNDQGAVLLTAGHTHLPSQLSRQAELLVLVTSCSIQNRHPASTGSGVRSDRDTGSVTLQAVLATAPFQHVLGGVPRLLLRVNSSCRDAVGVACCVRPQRRSGWLISCGEGDTMHGSRLANHLAAKLSRVSSL